MQMKLSDYVVSFLAGLGIKHAFVVSGGASIHLLHSLNTIEGIEPICPHHEQSGAMAADAYARVSGFGCAMATSGPGATNLITGIAGAWFDSIPVLYLTGQVTTFRLKGDTGVRQYGFQETEILPMVEPITKYSVQLRDPRKIRYELEKSVNIAKSGRPGPVLIDIPDDLQRQVIDVSDLEPFVAADLNSEGPISDGDLDFILSQMADADRPVMVWGSGIRLSGAIHKARQVLDLIEVPVLTTWGAKDMLANDHKFNAGTFGSHGTRSGNFIMQNADFVLSIGARLSTRETGTPMSDWARGAKVAVVDVDEAELNKFEAFGRPVDLKIQADAGSFLDALTKKELVSLGKSDWKQRVVDWKVKYKDVPRSIQTTKVDPYDFIAKLTRKAPDDTHIFTDTGCSVAWLMQAGELKLGQRTYHDFNNTAMGWGLPAAIGGALATSGETICITGDGSLMMSVQEFATAVAHKLPVKTILMDNSGYSMVRQTEGQWLDGVNVGTSIESGLAFPDWYKLGGSFGVSVKRLETSTNACEAIDWLLAQRGPTLLIVDIDPAEYVVPQVAFGYPIEDAEPHLPRGEFLEQMIVAPLAVSLKETDPKKSL